MILGVDCGQAPSLANTYQDGWSGYYGDMISYTCVDGYWFNASVSSVTSSCQANGEWTHILSKCTGIFCI